MRPFIFSQPVSHFKHFEFPFIGFFPYGFNQISHALFLCQIVRHVSIRWWYYVSERCTRIISYWIFKRYHGFCGHPRIPYGFLRNPEHVRNLSVGKHWETVVFTFAFHFFYFPCPVPDIIRDRKRVDVSWNVFVYGLLYPVHGICWKRRVIIEIVSINRFPYPDKPLLKKVLLHFRSPWIFFQVF